MNERMPNLPSLGVQSVLVMKENPWLRKMGRAVVVVENTMYASMSSTSDPAMAVSHANRGSALRPIPVR